MTKLPFQKAMLWLAGLSATFLLLTGIIAIWGLTLTPHYENQYSITIPVDRDKLWQDLTAPEKRALWDGQILRTEQLSNGDTKTDQLSRWKDIYANQTEVNYTITTDGTSLSLMRKVDDPNLPIHFSWAISLQDAKSETRVNILEQGQVDNPIVRYLVYNWVGEDIFAKRFIEQLKGLSDQKPSK
jgi:hypothetical protein